MHHVLIGASQAAHVREYVRSYELATGTRPHLVGWGALCGGGDQPVLPVQGGSPGEGQDDVIVRLAAPTPEEVAAIQQLGGAQADLADGEAAQAGVTGLLRACSLLDREIVRQYGPGCVPRYATPPTSLAVLSDRALRALSLERDGIPQPARWGRAASYEALRDRLRRSRRRAVVRLARGLLQAPTVVLWMGGRGLRAQANCCFTQKGARRTAVHLIEDEADLRPLLGRLFELGAVVHEDWACAELNGRPFALSLLVARGRVVLGRVVPGGALPGSGPGPGMAADPVALPEFALVKAQLGRPLYEGIEGACVRLAQLHRCAGLVVEVGVSRRFDGFAVLDVDPFAELPAPGVRDALGWSASDHLVRAVRTLPPEIQDPQDRQDTPLHEAASP